MKVKKIELHELKHVGEMFQEDLQETEKRLKNAKTHLSSAQLITLRSAYSDIVDGVNKFGSVLSSITLEK